LQTNYYEIAKELKNRLLRELPIVEVRVFGSCARNEATENSDIDIFIETETLTRTAKEKIREIAWQVGLDKTVVISPLIFSKEEVERSPLRASPIVLNILHEGITV
jgi:predicted nucleotidyltransferase